MCAPARPSLIHHRDFTKLWAAETVSVMGSQISQLAIPLVAILLLNASPLEVGVLTAAEFLPFLLVGLPAGVWVDRLRRRPILIVADLGRAVALASIPFAYLLGVLSMLQLYAVGFAVGIMTVFFDVAYTSYLPVLVERDQLLEGNSKLQVSQSAAQIAGPGVAGALVQIIGAPIAILIDSASFVASAVSLALIRKREPAPERAPAGSDGAGMRRQIAEGLRFVLRNPYLLGILVSASLSNLFSALFSAVILLFAVRTLVLDPPTIGIILALGNTGLLCGALVARRAGKRFGIGHAIIGGGVVSGAGFMLIPLATTLPPVPIAIGGIFIGTFASMIFNINQLSLRQAITPPTMLGRMNATVRFVAWGTLPLGALIGGVLGSVIGIVPTLWIGAIGSFLAFLPLLRSPVASVRDLPEHPDSADDPGADAKIGPGTPPIEGVTSNKPAAGTDLAADPAGRG